MKTISIICITLIYFLYNINAKEEEDICKWTSNTGSHFNLKPLMKKEGEKSYHLKDGDIPCTPETEPNYSYLWNFCSPVTKVSYPPNNVCEPTQIGGGLQYLDRSDGYQECNVIGRLYNDDKIDDIVYGLLDQSDPSKGISMIYPFGDKCGLGNTAQKRSVTVDISCENTKSIVVSALEPSKCQYHMIMKSYYGCPTECPITENGLCNSHGHCAYDNEANVPYCYCNEGFYGPACDNLGVSNSDQYDGYSVQVGLMVTLLIVAIVLVVVVGYMVIKVTNYRKAQRDFEILETASLHGTEMVGSSNSWGRDTIKF